MEKNTILLDIEALAQQIRGKDIPSAQKEIAEFVKVVINDILQAIRFPINNADVCITTRGDDTIDSTRLTFRMSHNK